LAISKERKEELVQQYIEWANQSQALFLTEYRGLNMKQVDELRECVIPRSVPSSRIMGSGFGKGRISCGPHFGQHRSPVRARNAPDMARYELRASDFVKIKGGYLETADQREDVVPAS
jgi:hypothetical protein